MKQLQLTGRQLITGPGALSALKNLDFTRALLITGSQSMFRSGVIDRIRTLLSPRGLVKIYSGIGANPTCAEVEAGLSEMHAFQPDLIIAVGGGSAIDAAKAMLLFYEYPSLNFQNVFQSSLPQTRTKTTFVAIPSTSGTASEVTHVTVITFPGKKQKLAIKTEAIRPNIAILDGEICLSLPSHIAAETGMDALTHALECYTNHSKDTFTDLLAEGAIRGILSYLPSSVHEGTLESRQKMHEYACMAGMAFSNAGLGLCHSMAHALGAQAHIAHGRANAILLPYVMSFNAGCETTLTPTAGRYAELAALIGMGASSTRQSALNLIHMVRRLETQMKMPLSIKDAGISAADFDAMLDTLADAALADRCMATTPIPCSREDIVSLYRQAYAKNSRRSLQ